MQSEYLLYVCLIAVSPIVGLLLQRNMKWPKFKALAAIFVVGLPFVVLDIFVTDLWWYFNPDFVFGLLLFGVPIEEYLFFVGIPWACLVIWEQLRHMDMKIISARLLYGFSITFGGILTIMASQASMNYTTAAVLMFAVFCMIDSRFNAYLVQKNGLLMFGIVTLCILVFDGYLTARPVVTYNHAMITNWRVLSVPIEDFLYGWTLILFNVYVYEYFRRRWKL